MFERFFITRGRSVQKYESHQRKYVFKKKVQMPTPGGNDHVKANNGGSETNQGNGDKKRHTRGQNQNNRGENQQ